MDYTKHYRDYIQARNERLRQRERVEMIIGLALIALFTTLAIAPFIALLAEGGLRP